MTKAGKIRPKRGSHLVAVLPDFHIPYHDEAAVSCALKVLQRLQPRRVVLLGDFLDCASFSAHPKRTLLETLAIDYHNNEIVPGNQILDQIQATTQHTVMLEGNHEFRVERFLVQQSPTVAAALHKLVSPQALLSAGRKRFTWIPYSDNLPHYEITPNLWALHGWYHCKNAAQAHLDRVRTVSVVHGHTHRQQLVSTRNVVTNEVYKAWSPGCLAKLQPMYRHQQPTEWVHGLSLIYVGRDPNDWTEYLVTIEDGRCVLPDGTVVRA